MSKTWRAIIVAVVVGWAVSELFPPQDRDLVKVLSESAKPSQVDQPFRAMVDRATQLTTSQNGAPLSFDQWTNLLRGINLARYFPGDSIPRKFRPKENEDTNRVILNWLERTKAAGQIQLGLDLKGGTQFVVEVQTGSIVDKEGALDQAINILRRRVDRFGVAEPILQKAGANRIIIQIPGLSQSKREEAKRNIKRVATLQFHLVHPDNNRLAGLDIPGYTNVLETISDDASGVKRKVEVLIGSKVELSGDHMAAASVARDPTTGVPKIHFSLDDVGAKLFYELTGKHVGERLAIVLVDLIDSEQGVQEEWSIVSAPTILSRIGGSGEITGVGDMAEARELANILENPLSTPLRIVEERDVDPSLGADSVKQGFNAALYGVIMVVIFMAGYYLLSGLIANFAVVLNIVILMGIFCYFDSTLTLPGIAGIALTIGMAVDANVLINERIREELASGKSLRGAISAGYDKAFGTIFDSNLTTVIASVILYWLGHGPVKGFGITLTIGIAASMFTALVVTRLMFDFLIDRGWLKDSLKMFSFMDKTNYDFLKYARPAFIASWIIILASVGYAVTKGSDKILGIDFAGGRTLVMSYKKENKAAVKAMVESGKMRDQLAESVVSKEAALAGKESQFQIGLQTSLGGEEYIRVDFPDVEGAEDVVEKQLQANFDGTAGFIVRSSAEKVGASVSTEIQKSALVATVLAMLGILIYVAFRYEFSFAVGAIVAILHDVLITLGIFFLSGRELNGPILAAILTIIGYSINDTIVIFDRVRESLLLGARGSFKDVMNLALNQTLARTIITSSTTFLSTLALYFFGGPVINDFAFTFLVGIITGTYSSIYIACAIVLWWHKGKRPELSMPVIAEPAPANA